MQEVYYVEQVLRLRKAPNYTGTKWYRGGTENMAGNHRYLYTGTYIGTSIYPYIYPHIHIYLHILKYWHESPNFTGTKWYRGGTKNMAGTHRYLIYRYLYRYLYIPIYIPT